MTKKSTEILSTIVELLEPLPSEERQRVVKAALVMLGETSTAPLSKNAATDTDEDRSTLPPKVRLWAKQNDVSQEMLDQVFHLKEGAAEVIAEPPGKSQREKTINAYILAGISQFLATGETGFSDKIARDLCNTSGCYSSTNHATYLKEKGSDFTGTRETGWTLTSPGLKRGAMLVKSIAGSNT